MIEQQAVADTEESEASTWWAVDDFPVRKASRAAFLIDGRMTMLEMCQCFLSARHTVHITAWGLSPELLLVRGKHHRAGPDGSPEQEALLAWLRAKGLAEQDLRFCQQCEEPSVQNVLSYVASKLSNPFSGMALFAKQARENMLAVKAGQPLVGHLYISHEWAREYEVTVHPVNGWLAGLPNNA